MSQRKREQTIALTRAAVAAALQLDFGGQELPPPPLVAEPILGHGPGTATARAQ